MKFDEYKIEHFINDLSGDLSSPGGGSVAALVTSLAASLNQMVYSFTIDKKSFEKLTCEEKNQMRQFSEEAKSLTKVALEVMDKDRDAFTDLMDCFKLPKETEEDKSIRSEKIFESTKKSMSVPLELAEKASKFYDNIEFAINKGNKNLLSDAVVAAILLNASIESAVVNVYVNYNSLKVKEEFRNIPEKCKEILKESMHRKNRIVETFYC